MNHLAIDLGTTNHISEGVLFDPTEPSNCQFIKFPTARDELSRIYDKYKPTKIIIESCRTAHWVVDHLKGEPVDVFVANTNTEDFQLAKKRRKTDRLDAERLRTLFLLGKLKRNALPSASSVEMKQLIDFRGDLVAQRTSYKNRIRMLLDQIALTFRPGKSGWTKSNRKVLWDWCKQAPDGVPSGSWQRHLKRLLTEMEQREVSILECDRELRKLTDEQQHVQKLQEIPGMGPLTSAAVAATIDDPQRFKNTKQVSRFSGFDPIPYESGKKAGCIGISRRNWSTMRGYIFEACQIAIHRLKEPWMHALYTHLAQKTGNKKKALCAVARRVFIKAWLMLRYDQTWEQVTQRRSVV